MDPSEFFPPLKTHFNPNLRTELSLNLQQEYIHNPLPWRTVRDAIGDLPKPVGKEIRRDEKSPLDLHFGRTPTETSLKRYMAIPNEGMNRFDLQRIAPEITPKCWIKKTSGGTDLFGRLWWDRPSVTIRTEFFKPEKGRYLHPCEHRPITHREAARIQSFPDSFRFLGTKIEIAKQIGNAVPPQLAAHVAGCVEKLIEAKNKEKSA
jgi:DNA (cytosine-5)-methyltransferase 1